jgi:hypothetical protein
MHGYTSKCKRQWELVGEQGLQAKGMHGEGPGVGMRFHCARCRLKTVCGAGVNQAWGFGKGTPFPLCMCHF